MRKTRTKLKPNLGEEKGGGVILPPPRPVAVFPLITQKR